MSRTLILWLQFPKVITTLWGKLAGKTMTVLPRTLWIYCTAMAAYVYQTPTFTPHYRDNVKVKSQHICQAIPVLLRCLGEAVVTNDWCIIYSLWCSSHKNLVLSQPPKNILTPNAKYVIRWYNFQPISKYIPTPSLVSLSDLNCWGAERALFLLNESIFTWITPTGWALWSFSHQLQLPGITMHILHCLVSTNQYLE